MQYKHTKAFDALGEDHKEIIKIFKRNKRNAWHFKQSK